MFTRTQKKTASILPLKIPAINIKRAAMKKKGKLMIGTSNIVVPGKRETFPGDFRNGSRLHYYSSLFNSLEVWTRGK